MNVIDPSASGRPGLPERRITISQLVAYNMAAFRKAADLSQQELGQRLGGWSVASVSAAERSWESKRVKKFDADEIMQIAAVLGVPLAGLFLPPEDHGTAVRYVVRLDGSSAATDLEDLLPLVLPAAADDSAAMDAYRKRIIAAGASGFQVDNLETARRVLELAQQTADEAIGAARGAADETLGRARSETEVLLAMARRQAEQITADAASRAMALERDTQERHRQAMGSLVQSREELERRVDDLRTFEREYRSRLKVWLESQFRELLEGVTGAEVDKTLEDLRKHAAETPDQRISAVLLRENGTYDVLQLGPGGSGGSRPQEKAPDQGGYRRPEYRPPDVGEYEQPETGETR